MEYKKIEKAYPIEYESRSSKLLFLVFRLKILKIVNPGKKIKTVCANMYLKKTEIPNPEISVEPRAKIKKRRDTPKFLLRFFVSILSSPFFH